MGRAPSEFCSFWILEEEYFRVLADLKRYAQIILRARVLLLSLISSRLLSFCISQSSREPNLTSTECGCSTARPRASEISCCHSRKQLSPTSSAGRLWRLLVRTSEFFLHLALLVQFWNNHCMSHAFNRRDRVGRPCLCALGCKSTREQVGFGFASPSLLNPRIAQE